jgi:tetratricopeptide (TPR) repeat protein
MTTGIVARAYTLGSEEFEFRGVPVNVADQYFLAIDEPGYGEVRERIELGRDPFGVGAYVAGGMIMLYLESLPPDETAPDTAPTVDVRQLTTEISDEARQAYESALTALEDGDADTAVGHLERAIEFTPDYYDALNQLGVVYVNAQRFREARGVLEHAFELNQNDPLLLTNLGTLHFQEGQALEQTSPDATDAAAAAASYAEAANYLEQAIRLDPGSARVAYYLGSALYKTGAYERAEEALFVAIETDPEWDEARLTLVNIYVRQQRHEAALSQIELYLEENPDTPDRESIEQARDAIERTLGR